MWHGQTAEGLYTSTVNVHAPSRETSEEWAGPRDLLFLWLVVLGQQEFLQGVGEEMGYGSTLPKRSAHWDSRTPEDLEILQNCCPKAVPPPCLGGTRGSRASASPGPDACATRSSQLVGEGGPGWPAASSLGRLQLKKNQGSFPPLLKGQGKEEAWLLRCPSRTRASAWQLKDLWIESSSPLQGTQPPS